MVVADKYKYKYRFKWLSRYKARLEEKVKMYCFLIYRTDNFFLWLSLTNWNRNIDSNGLLNLKLCFWIKWKRIVPLFTWPAISSFVCLWHNEQWTCLYISQIQILLQAIRIWFNNCLFLFNKILWNYFVPSQDRQYLLLLAADTPGQNMTQFIPQVELIIPFIKHILSDYKYLQTSHLVQN